MNNLAGGLGDIFWDLQPSITYSPGSELGCTLYIANPTDIEREYALMSRLSSNEIVISEESIKVYGYAWFKVDPGDFIRLHGALRFDETDCVLSVMLIERESGELTDYVSTSLSAPTVTTPGWPGGWPEGTTVIEAGFSWFLPMLMLGMMGVMIAGMFKPEEEKRIAVPIEERKLLPLGRED